LPRDDAGDGKAEDGRCLEAHGAVLRVARTECGQCSWPLAPGGEDGTFEVEPDPGEPRPVVFVVVDQQGSAWVAAEVGDTSERGTALRLFVDGDGNDGAGGLIEEGETDGDEVGTAAGADGREARDGFGGEEGAFAGTKGERLHVVSVAG